MEAKFVCNLKKYRVAQELTQEPVSYTHLRVGIVEKVMNDGSIGSTFNEGHLTVEGEDAYCIDINTDFKNGYKTRADASSRMSIDQISDVALSIEYVKQYTDRHSGISKNHAYLLRQLVVWQRLRDDMCRDAWAWQSKNPMGYGE